MRVNGIERAGAGTLAAAAAAYKPDADMAVVDGVAVPGGEWGAFALSGDSDVVLAKRGELPERGEYMALLSSRNPPGTAERMASARVGIAGCGGLGSHAALALARMGIGGLTLADFDVVEPTNLNRQCYGAADIGKPKVDALAARLSGVNPFIVVKKERRRLTRDNVGGIFSGCGVVVECLDRPGEKRMLVETALAEMPEAAVVAASGLAGLGEANRIVTRRAGKRLWLCGDGESGVLPGLGLAAPRVMIAAGHQALCAARIVLGMEEF